ncbi:NfeD family protein [Nocardioides yefusunii]|uniref:NfeD family protein n=1 Tax=Nocardioides yefusunii TaxID=2500546 RepID=A0ABW1QSQ1_9ACTN|nr:NfeD family protein [Nocardioides yefusunii]
MDWISDHLWESWLALAVVLLVAEVLSLELVLMMLAGGAVVGMAADLVGLPLPFQVLAACVAAVAALVLLRPPVLRRLRQGPELTQGHARLLGAQGVVLREVSVHAPGLVAFGQDEWTSVPYDETVVIPVGATVEVFEIRGASAVVHLVRGPELAPGA